MSSRRYLCMKFIVMDANFRLKRCMMGSDQHDPALGSGWGYFVEDSAYKAHVLEYATQEDVRVLPMLHNNILQLSRSAHALDLPLSIKLTWLREHWGWTCNLRPSRLYYGKWHG